MSREVGCGLRVDGTATDQHVAEPVLAAPDADALPTSSSLVLNRVPGDRVPGVIRDPALRTASDQRSERGVVGGFLERPPDQRLRATVVSGDRKRSKPASDTSLLALLPIPLGSHRRTRRTPLGDDRRENVPQRHLSRRTLRNQTPQAGKIPVGENDQIGSLRPQAGRH